MSTVLAAIRPGDRVTIVNAQGQQRTGRVVFAFADRCVLNMGGRYGTPAVATDANIVRVQPKR